MNILPLIPVIGLAGIAIFELWENGAFSRCRHDWIGGRDQITLELTERHCFKCGKTQRIRKFWA